VGRFPFVGVSGDMPEKNHFPYTNRLDRVEFNLGRPAGDGEKWLDLQQALKNE